MLLFRSCFSLVLGCFLLLWQWNDNSLAVAASKTPSKVHIKKSAKRPVAGLVRLKPKTQQAQAKTAKYVKTRHAPGRASKSLTDASKLVLASNAALVLDIDSGEVLYQKNPTGVLPIASITKLMTAMLVLDAKQSLEEELTITEEDIDILKNSHSRLQPGISLRRDLLLNLALMSSDNRAAHALARNFPGGITAFVAAMNAKAADLGLRDTSFMDPTGLTPANVSSAYDLARLVAVAQRYPIIREYSTMPQREVTIGGQALLYRNSNALVRQMEWDIELSKTGYISEAGRCVVMQTKINGRSIIIVLLDAHSSSLRVNDALRIKRWTENYAIAAGDKAS